MFADHIKTLTQQLEPQQFLYETFLWIKHFTSRRQSLKRSVSAITYSIYYYLTFYWWNILEIWAPEDKKNIRKNQLRYILINFLIFFLKRFESLPFSRCLFCFGILFWEGGHFCSHTCHIRVLHHPCLYRGDSGGASIHPTFRWDWD